MSESLKIVAVAENWLGAKIGSKVYDEIINVFNTNGRYKADDQQCCEFVCACFIKALGLNRAKNLIPIINYANGQVKLWESKYFVSKPAVGDIVYFGTPVNHVELVIDVTGANITTIDGNNNHTVTTRRRSINDGYINCFVRPDYREDKAFIELSWKNAVIESVSLKKGSSGSLVLWMQKYLKSKGFYLDGRNDGIFGDVMDNAVKQFQHNNNLFVDGIIAKYCWTYILK